jgi:hypothetical protein
LLWTPAAPCLPSSRNSFIRWKSTYHSSPKSSKQSDSKVNFTIIKKVKVNFPCTRQEEMWGSVHSFWTSRPLADTWWVVSLTPRMLMPQPLSPTLRAILHERSKRRVLSARVESPLRHGRLGNHNASMDALKKRKISSKKRYVTTNSNTVQIQYLILHDRLYSKIICA